MSETEPPIDASTQPREAASPPPPPGEFDPRSIDLGRVECLQILNERGELDEGLTPDFSDDDLRRVHRAMVLSRAFDARMLAMQRQGQMGTFAPNIGQEACMIGQVWPLGPSDWFSPSYRAFGAQIWRGWSMERLMTLWAGYHEGFPPPEGVNDLPFSIVIGSHVLPATGIAMGMRRAADPHCVVVNFGDGAFSQGAVAEALNFAAVEKAPVVFVCENNGWAISTPLAKQAGSDLLAARGVGYGVHAIRVDGNDILAMMTAMGEACERARRGEGPTLVEAVTFRMSLHTTADDPTVYRDESIVEPWKSRCPIKRFESWLVRTGRLDPTDGDRIRAACEEEVLEARARFRSNAQAKPREAFDHLYQSIPPELEAQRMEYLRRLDRKGVE
ncbi:MAG: thiamine pyrophosphate-dependent dehydrogenase E1 component subunit alpha [Phycisphaerales bacterium]|jgi:TPP-dependent pyruvate/acetoin dehydrogenase alpha subunit|nr:thiamine pyrophosphate-dependent dehydrogenase E1 component subunit alpha [Phycisphaerales bacterium]